LKAFKLNATERDSHALGVVKAKFAVLSIESQRLYLSRGSASLSLPIALAAHSGDRGAFVGIFLN
jgi:hypothetical protein